MNEEYPCTWILELTNRYTEGVARRQKAEWPRAKLCGRALQCSRPHSSVDASGRSGGHIAHSVTRPPCRRRWGGGGRLELETAGPGAQHPASSLLSCRCGSDAARGARKLDLALLLWAAGFPSVSGMAFISHALCFPVWVLSFSLSLS